MAGHVKNALRERRNPRPKERQGKEYLRSKKSSLKRGITTNRVEKSPPKKTAIHGCFLGKRERRTIDTQSRSTAKKKANRGDKRERTPSGKQEGEGGENPFPEKTGFTETLSSGGGGKKEIPRRQGEKEGKRRRCKKHEKRRKRHRVRLLL